MKLLISGHTSKISLELMSRFNSGQRKFEFIRVGRDENSDYYCDFSNFNSIQTFVAKVLPTIEFNYVFLNHGILFGKRSCELNEKEVMNYMMVNCYSFLLLLEAISSRDGINTVVMSSISAKEGSYDKIYAAMKAGVDSFRFQAGRVVPPNSRLNFVSPGIIEDAKMTTTRHDSDNVEHARLKTPTKALTNSAEVASLISFLLTEPGNINLQDIGINGGTSLNR